MPKTENTYDPDILLEGLAGFMQWAFDNNKEPGWILTNVIHDVFEYLRNGEEDCFSPRTASYQKYLKL